MIPALQEPFRRVYLHHIRKTGGTSLNFSFFALAGRDPKSLFSRMREDGQTELTECGITYVTRDKAKIEGGKYFYAFSHHPSHELRPPPDTFSITVLRDPIERVVSHYRMLRQYEELGVKKRWLTVEREWLGGSFREFVGNVPRHRLLNQLYTFSASLNVREALEALDRCSHVMHLDTFEQGMKALSEKLGLQLQSFHERPANFGFALDPADRSILVRELAPEFEFLARAKQKMEPF